MRNKGARRVAGKQRNEAIRLLVDLLCLAVVVGCLLALNEQSGNVLFPLIARLTSKRIQPSWPRYLHLLAQTGLWLTVLFWVLFRGILPYWRHIRRALAAAGHIPARLLDHAPESLRRLLLKAWNARDHLPDCPPSPVRWRFGWADGLILAVFLLYGTVLFLNRIQGPYPYVKFGSDAGNIAGFAAAQQHPELFHGDELLANPANLRSYNTLNIPLLNLLEKLAGNYALAFAWLILPHIFINLAGWYLLGMVWFDTLLPTRRRVWAVLLTLALAAPVELNLMETWGITPDPVTRFTFQALLPYLLALIVLWRDQPRRWPVIAALIGLMAFVHPVSTPTWVCAIWLGMLALLPKGWSLRAKARVMVGLGLVTVAALTPYALQYLGVGGQPKSLSYNLFMRVITEYFPENILNIPTALQEFIHLSAAWGLLEVFLILLGMLLWLRWHDRRKLDLALLWLAGVLFASLVVPYIEHRIEADLQIVPLETELVRGLRYGVFFMLFFTTWGLAELYSRLGESRRRFVPLGLAVLLCAGWMLNARLSLIAPTRLAGCLRQGQVLCIAYDAEDLAVQAVRERTPQGAPILVTFADNLSMSYSMPIRYLALRPLVFTYKDRGQLVTARSTDLEIWYTRYQAVKELNGLGLPAEERMDGFLRLADHWGADYILADFKVAPEWLRSRSAVIVYENDRFVLIRVR